jgi:hypothetical protein
MVITLTHSQLILRYQENGGRIEPYTIVIMVYPISNNLLSKQNKLSFENIQS